MEVQKRLYGQLQSEENGQREKWRDIIHRNSSLSDLDTKKKQLHHLIFFYIFQFPAQEATTTPAPTQQRKNNGLDKINEESFFIHRLDFSTYSHIL